MSLELSGPDVSRPFIEAARPDHPSLLDPTHRMGALFGVVNVPNVVWVDEEGTVVRPPEPGWPGPRDPLPRQIGEQAATLGRAPGAPSGPGSGVSPQAVLSSGQDRSGYADALRDWVDRGADSVHALTPDEVVARSQPRPVSVSQAAAHFELATHLWAAGERHGALAHFRDAHRLQPGNWTYKRQAWSLVGAERVGGDYGRYAQSPVKGEEQDWPFDSDFASDLAQLGEGEYYPRTL